MWLYFSAFILCFKWKTHIDNIHLTYMKEQKNDIQFAQRMFIEYLFTFILGMFNFFVWLVSYYLLILILK